MRIGEISKPRDGNNEMVKVRSPIGWAALVCVGLAVIGAVAAEAPQIDAKMESWRVFCNLERAAAVARRLGLDPPPHRITLVADNEDPASCKTVQARLLNFGQETVHYGAEFVIQRHGPAGWETDPSSPVGPWPRFLGKLKPGAAGRCYGFSVPADQPIGRYRFVSKVSEKFKRQRKTAEFRIS
jgi:hypothetical protein